jgi:hypothetical protein
LEEPVTVVERLKRAFYRLVPRYRPKSLMRQAIDYALNQWTTLTVFLEHGEVELSNNWVENAIRPSAAGLFVLHFLLSRRIIEIWLAYFSFSYGMPV